MKDNTRKIAKAQLDGLLTHWQIIELWLKKSEHVSKKSAVPAINELRYASRQLFNAVRIYGKHKLTPGDVSALNKRMLIAEQYLFNADHDIFDSLHSFFKDEVELNELVLHESEIRIRFKDYHIYKSHINSISDLITGARSDYFVRKTNYETIRDNHILFLIENRGNYVSAVADAMYDNRNLEQRLKREKLKSKIYGFAALLSVIFTIIFSPIGLYAWLSSEEFCRKHTAEWATLFCEVKQQPSDG